MKGCPKKKIRYSSDSLANSGQTVMEISLHRAETNAFRASRLRATETSLSTKMKTEKRKRSLQSGVEARQQQ